MITEAVGKGVSLSVVEKKFEGIGSEPREIFISFDSMDITEFSNQAFLDNWQSKFSKRVKECESKLIPIVDRYNKLEAVIEVLNESWDDFLIRSQIDELKRVIDTKKGVNLCWVAVV